MAQTDGNQQRGLGQKDAAAYVGVPVSAFLQMVAKGHMPAPLMLDGHVLWDRHRIDRYFDVLGAKTPDMKAWEELLKLALGDDAPKESETVRSATGKPPHWHEMPAGPDREKQRAKEGAKWRAEVRGSPLGKWERVALWELFRRRGKLVDANMMRGVTFRTHDSLKARGYVTRRDDENGQARYWQITKKGIEAVKKLPEEVRPALRET